MDFSFNINFTKWAYGVFIRMYLVACCVHSYVSYSKSKPYKCISYVFLKIDNNKTSRRQMICLEASIEAVPLT